MDRFRKFARSVIPKDPFQLFFLAGIVCLVAARGTSWRPTGMDLLLDASDLRETVQIVELFLLYLLIFASAAGYFICFWPGDRPVRRIFLFVISPVLLSAGLLLGCRLYLSGPPSSALESETGAFLEKLRWGRIVFRDLPEGYVLTLAGLLFIVVYVSRLAFGIARLPLSLSGGDESCRQDLDSWRRTLRLTWFLLALVSLFSVLPFVLTWAMSELIGLRSSNQPQSNALYVLSTVVAAAFALWVSLVIAGPNLRKDVWRQLRLPSWKWCLFAFSIPVGISICLSTGQFLVDRALWATRNRGMQPPPNFGDYFAPGHLFMLLSFAGVIFEEIVFRGVLQSQLIRRFGLYRGVFLVGVTWGAFHFYFDFSFFHSAAWYVVVVVISRLFLCVALGFVLSWLTLQSRSVIPAIIAHGFFNVVVVSQPMAFFGKGEVRAALCGVLGYALFRYWPVQDESLSEPLPTSIAALESPG